MFWGDLCCLAASGLNCGVVVTAALEAKDDSDFDQAGQYFARGISPLLIQAGTTLVGMGVAKATSAGAKLVGTRIAALKVSKNPITSEGGKLRVDPAIIADAEADGATAATGKLKDADALKPAKAAGVPKEGPSLGEPRVGVPAKAVAPAAEAPEYAGAAAKGYPGIKITPNGGPDFAGTKYLYDKLQPGQKNIVRIKLQGSRYKDFKEANRLAGFEGAKPPKGYSWHHIDDFNTTTGEATMQLIETGAHKAAYIHKGGVWQYERFHGVKYK
ncbi:MAG TPA: HNH endonuclease [Gemmataceae bacterium]|nr:HNH endonuclease [Gemmataceae bacterium]